METIKPRDLQKMRMRGQISKQELDAVMNMFGRHCSGSIDDKVIVFNNGEIDIARIERKSQQAIIYENACCPEYLKSYAKGMSGAGYKVPERYLKD
jgi:hypothetical protein